LFKIFEDKDLSLDFVLSKDGESPACEPGFDVFNCGVRVVVASRNFLANFFGDGLAFVARLTEKQIPFGNDKQNGTGNSKNNSRFPSGMTTKEMSGMANGCDVAPTNATLH